REKGGEREVALEVGRELGGALCFRERIDAAQPSALEEALLAHRLDGAQSGSLEQRARDLGFAVEELGPELDRDVESGHAPRPAAAADALARFEHQSVAAFA